MELLRQSAYRVRPWKNGAGVSYEIAQSREALAKWSLSLASIVSDAPFSDYSGYDRTFVVVSGQGVVLHLEGGAQTVATTLKPIEFPGERHVLSTLLRNPVRALNVMTLRGAYRHQVELARLDADVWRSLRPHRAFAYLLTGASEGDTVRFVPGERLPHGIEGTPCLAVAIFRG